MQQLPLLTRPDSQDILAVPGDVLPGVPWRPTAPPHAGADGTTAPLAAIDCVRVPLLDLGKWVGLLPVKRVIGKSSRSGRSLGVRAFVLSTAAEPGPPGDGRKWTPLGGC